MKGDMDTNTLVLAQGSAPTLGFIGWIIIGGLAGWIGSKIMKTDEQMGLMLNIVVGVIGGFLGGWLLTLLGLDEWRLLVQLLDLSARCGDPSVDRGGGDLEEEVSAYV